MKMLNKRWTPGVQTSVWVVILPIVCRKELNREDKQSLKNHIMGADPPSKKILSTVYRIKNLGKKVAKVQSAVEP
jgi:hypothetical protein